MRYDDKNTWIRPSGERYEVGLTKHIVEQSEEFIFVQLPEVGSHLSKGDTFVTLESVKSAGQIPSPVSGVVEEVNLEVFDDPARINENPERAWIMKLRIDDPDEYESLRKEP